MRMVDSPLLFISYSHADRGLMTRIKNQLASLSNLLQIWNDEKLRAGESEGWESILMRQLEQSRIIVVLLSPDFTVSRYCQDKELPHILRRKKDPAYLVYFIKIEPHVVPEELTKYLVVPTDKKAISEFENPGAAIEEIVRQIQADVKALPPEPAAPEILRKLKPAHALEKEILENLAIPLGLSDKQWSNEARRLDPSLGDYATLQQIVEHLTRRDDAELAGATLAVLLIRAARAAGQESEIRDKLRTSSLSGRYDAAYELVSKLNLFELPCIVLVTKEIGRNKLGVIRAFLYDAPGQTKSIYSSPSPGSYLEIGDALERATDDCDDPNPVVHVVAPLRAILSPPAEVLQIAARFPVVFRLRDRVEGTNAFQTFGNLLAARTESAKAHAAGHPLQVAWFEATENLPQSRLHAADHTVFPAVHTGTATDSEKHLSRLLLSLIPFAAFTRPSIRELAAPNHQRLPEVLPPHTPFAKIPTIVASSCGDETCILSHLSIVWDDPILPELKYRSGTPAKKNAVT